MAGKSKSKTIRYREISLRPYVGSVLLFSDLAHVRAKYEAETKEPYPYQDEEAGGRFIRLDGANASGVRYLVYARHAHVLAHEFTHVLFDVFKKIGATPDAEIGEPFCYMLSQMMLDAAGSLPIHGANR